MKYTFLGLFYLLQRQGNTVRETQTENSSVWWFTSPKATRPNQGKAQARNKQLQPSMSPTWKAGTQTLNHKLLPPRVWIWGSQMECGDGASSRNSNKACRYPKCQLAAWNAKRITLQSPLSDSPCRKSYLEQTGDTAVTML